jgi:beta-lactamase class A
MKSEMNAPARFWQKKVSPLYSILILIAAITFFACTVGMRSSSEVAAVQPAIQQDCQRPVNFRMQNYAFARPLLLSDEANESQRLQGLKHEINGLLNARKNSGDILTAAVHVVSLNDGDWIAINDGERFNPGSLFKVPVLMTFFREEEKRPGLLDQKLTLPLNIKVPVQTFNEKYIVPGKSYTIRELIYNMIVKSDNYATYLLNLNVNVNEFRNFFTTIGLPTPDIFDRNFSLTVSEYSKFLRVLYNATYLSNEDADYALTLMTQTTFKEGITRYLPDDVKVAHKFGEWGETTPGSLHQLHETGIVFLDNNPYLINIMTKGKEIKPLPHILSDVSKLVYDRFTAKKNVHSSL